MSDELPDMRASDAERERIADVLRDALADGRLGMDEFQERLDSTYQARTRGELVPLVRDLPHHGDEDTSGDHLPEVAGAQDASPPPSLRKTRRWTERIGGRATSRWGIGVMGGFGRRGQWTVPRVFTGIGIMGGGELDLREARFEDRDVVIRCFALMGGFSVTVPPGVGVEVRGVGIMGGFDSSASGFGDAGAPHVVITGVTVMGGVGVVRKIPREEKLKLRAERRQHRELERRDRREGRDRRRGHGGHQGGHHGGYGGHGSSDHGGKSL